MEIKRIQDISFDIYTYKSNCVECGEEFELFYNGGELDETRCCGNAYRLEEVQIDFVIEKV